MRTARGEFTERESVLLELRDADGVAGFGEAAPLPGFGT
jgi:L-alanine-DL-glutamate epimerase-like enolase superfamily enzyme